MTTRKKKWILVIAILVMIPSILVLGTIAVVERRLDAELAKIEARGEPIAFEDIVPPPVPDEENGAVELVRAFAMRPDADPRDSDILGVDTSAVRPITISGEDDGWLYMQTDRRFETMSAEELQRLRSLLSKYEPIFASIRRGLDKPTVRFDLHYEKCGATLLPHLNPLRISAKLLSLKADIAIYDGQTDRVIETIELLLDMAAVLDEEPTVISQLTGIAIRSVALHRVQSLVLTGNLDREQMGRLAYSLSQHIRRGAAKRWLMWERVWDHEGCDRLRRNPEAWRDYYLEKPLQLRFDTYISANETELLRFLGPFVDHADMCLKDYLAAPKPSPIPEWAKLAHLMYTFYYDNVIEDEAKSQAIIRSAHAALRSGARFKGGMPRADALALPEGPGGIDPYDGNPLHLRIGENGREVTAYSVGPNFLDDKGRPYLEPIVEWVDPETGEPPEDEDPFQPSFDPDPHADLERIERKPDENDPANFWDAPDTPAPGTPDDLRFRVRLVPKEG